MSKQEDVEELQKGIEAVEKQLEMIEELKEVKTGSEFAATKYIEKIKKSMDNAIVNARTKDEYLRLLIQRFEHEKVIEESWTDELQETLELKIEAIEKDLLDTDISDEKNFTEMLNKWNSLFLKKNLYKTMLEDLKNTDAKLEQLIAEKKDLENEIEELDKEED